MSPWWSVDLGITAIIDSLLITNGQYSGWYHSTLHLVRVNLIYHRCCVITFLFIAGAVGLHDFHVAISFEAPRSLDFIGYTYPGRGDMRVVYTHEGSVESSAYIGLTFTRWTVVGRYLVIYIPSTISSQSDSLRICEVLVFGFHGRFHLF